VSTEEAGAEQTKVTANTELKVVAPTSKANGNLIENNNELCKQVSQGRKKEIVSLLVSYGVKEDANQKHK
jgi:hypothetical protein